jgi:hypothetical protein
MIKTAAPRLGWRARGPRRNLRSSPQLVTALVVLDATPRKTGVRHRAACIVNPKLIGVV